MGLTNIPAIDELVQTGQVPATLGQKPAAESLSTVLASDQPVVPVAGTFTLTEPVSTKTVLVPLAPTSATATGTSSLAVAANAARTGLFVTNLGTKRVYLGLGVAAQPSKGIVLSAGGSWFLDEYCFTVAAINAITDGSTATLAIQEFE